MFIRDKKTFKNLLTSFSEEIRLRTASKYSFEDRKELVSQIYCGMSHNEIMQLLSRDEFVPFHWDYTPDYRTISFTKKMTYLLEEFTKKDIIDIVSQALSTVLGDVEPTMRRLSRLVASGTPITINFFGIDSFTNEHISSDSDCLIINNFQGNESLFTPTSANEKAIFATYDPFTHSILKKTIFSFLNTPQHQQNIGSMRRICISPAKVAALHNYTTAAELLDMISYPEKIHRLLLKEFQSGDYAGWFSRGLWMESIEDMGFQSLKSNLKEALDFFCYTYKLVVNDYYKYIYCNIVAGELLSIASPEYEDGNEELDLKVCTMHALECGYQIIEPILKMELLALEGKFMSK